MSSSGEFEINLSVRLLVNKLRDAEVRQCLRNSRFGVGEFFKDKSVAVYVIEILDEVDAERAIEAIRDLSGVIQKYDFFVSLSSSMDTGIIDVPAYFVLAASKMGVGVVVSYTIL